MVGLAFILCITVLGGRVAYWQIEYGDEFTRRVVATATRREQIRASLEIAPARGAIVDRHMQPIASSQPTYNIFLDVTLLHNGRSTATGRTVWENTLTALSERLDIPRRDLLALFETDNGLYSGNLRHPTNHRYIAHGVQASIALPLTDEFRHVHYTELSRRWHHDPFFAPHVIGFVRGDVPWGLESYYNDFLVGEAGRNIWLQGDVEEIPVRDGYTLVTTLDWDIQRIAQNIVDDTWRNLPSTADAVGMIVMNPNTGEILAMAQAPTFSLEDPFNPDYITDQRLRREWDYLTEAERVNAMSRLWANFHTTRSFEPGSIFKSVVVAAAIEEGVLSHNATFFCNRIRTVVDAEIRCWTSHGGLTLREAIYRSCNHAMIDIMNMFGSDSRARAAVFYRYRGYFGFAERTGIDFPYENAVSAPAVMYSLARLGPVELATSSMGQGFNLTSLQAINSFATIINGGNVMEPFLVSQIVDNNGNVIKENHPRVVRRAISEQTSEFMRREMQHVVSAANGTGRSSAVPGHAIGGKTGTGQQGRGTNINSLTYIAYTSVENPEFLVLMTIDRIYDPLGRFSAGGQVAPQVGRFFEELIRLRGLPPSEGDFDFSQWEVAMGAEIMPNFVGQNLVDVVRNINNVTNGGFQVVGSGTVISHTIPEYGRLMPQNSPIFFYMDNNTHVEGQMTIVPDVTGVPAEQAATLLASAGLTTAITVIDRPAQPPDPNAIPHTAGPTERTNGEEAPPPATQQPAPYTVFQQFPTPGTVVERGLQVMLRAR